MVHDVIYIVLLILTLAWNQVGKVGTSGIR